MGVKRVVFYKRAGISYHSMGVKIQTFKKLRDFRAGIEGNISGWALVSGNSSLFTDYLGHDYTLLEATSSGFSLPAPYNVDPNGNTRGEYGVWDICAYEY